MREMLLWHLDLRNDGSGTWTCTVSQGGDVDLELTLDTQGFVLVYPNLAERMPANAPLADPSGNSPEMLRRLEP